MFGKKRARLENLHDTLLQGLIAFDTREQFRLGFHVFQEVLEAFQAATVQRRQRARREPRSFHRECVKDVRLRWWGGHSFFIAHWPCLLRMHNAVVNVGDSIEMLFESIAQSRGRGIEPRLLRHAPCERREFVGANGQDMRLPVVMKLKAMFEMA